MGNEVIGSSVGNESSGDGEAKVSTPGEAGASSSPSWFENAKSLPEDRLRTIHHLMFKDSKAHSKDEMLTELENFSELLRDPGKWIMTKDNEWRVAVRKSVSSLGVWFVGLSLVSLVAGLIFDSGLPPIRWVVISSGFCIGLLGVLTKHRIVYLVLGVWAILLGINSLFSLYGVPGGIWSIVTGVLCVGSGIYALWTYRKFALPWKAIWKMIEKAEREQALKDLS